MNHPWPWRNDEEDEEDEEDEAFNPQRNLSEERKEKKRKDDHQQIRADVEQIKADVERISAGVERMEAEMENRVGCAMVVGVVRSIEAHLTYLYNKPQTCPHNCHWILLKSLQCSCRIHRENLERALGNRERRCARVFSPFVPVGGSSSTRSLSLSLTRSLRAWISKITRSAQQEGSSSSSGTFRRPRTSHSFTGCDEDFCLFWVLMADALPVQKGSLVALR